MKDWETEAKRWAFRNLTGTTDQFESTFADCVDRAMNRMEEGNFETEDATSEAIDEGLIYYSDQWAVLEQYCTPAEANWQEALEQFWDDVHRCVSDLYEHLKEEEEEETDNEEGEDE